MTSYPEALDDSLTFDVTLSPTTHFGLVNTDAITLGDATLQAMGYILADTVTFSGTPAYLVVIGRVLTELLQFQDTLAPNMTYGLTIADILAVADRVAAGLPVTLSDTVTFSDVVTITLAVLLASAFQLGDTTAQKMTYGLLLADQLSVNDALSRFLSFVLSDNLTLSATLANQYTAVTSMTDNLALADALANQMVFHVLMADTLDITDVDLLQMIYSGELTDNIVITALYVSPDGNFTTWVINTRTNAITEYKNWVFSSFATMGRKYIAANQNGLFELNGERDVTTNIVSTIQNGYMQMGGTKLSGLKGAYIAVNGQGQWLMTLEAGDGRSYTYKFTSQPNLMTTRIQVGKGLRSRYFSFILQNADGQDFNIESLEFVPILNTRRV